MDGPFHQEVVGDAIVEAQGDLFDLLVLGRRTYDIFAAY